MIGSDVPLQAKDPRNPPRVIAIGRLSKPKKTEQQTEETIESSLDVVRKYLKGMYEGPLEIRHLAEQESGLITDRATIVEAEELVATGDWDLVITEDLSRIYRNPRHQYVFVQDCVDARTRVICVGDSLDTADENWEVMMGAATLRHGLYIPDTRRRVRRSATSAFHGGRHDCKVKFGFRKLTREEAASGEHGPKDLRIVKRTECTQTIKDMITKLKATKCYEKVAQWLNDQGITPGPYVKPAKWKGRLVKELLEDPILTGHRTFRKMLFERIFRTGRYRRSENPNGPEKEHNPELAHLTEEEFQDVQKIIRQIDEVTKGGAVKGTKNPRYRIARSAAIFPAQQAVCSVCSEQLYRYDHDQLKCRNAHEYGADQCWNHVQLDCQTAREKIIPWMVQQLERFPQFREAVLDATWTSLQRLQRHEQQRGDSRTAQIADLEQQAARLADAIGRGGELEALVARLGTVEGSLRGLRAQQQSEEVAESGCGRCQSREELAGNLECVLLELAGSSYEFADLMREIMPELSIVPVQAIDCGLVRPRARITLRVADLRRPVHAGDVCGGQGDEVQVEIDLFNPPVHIQHLQDCIRERSQQPKPSYDQIAETLKINRMTVKRALSLARKMAAQGLSEPYRVLTAKPECASRWKQRRNSA